jgi:hypothetical protein
MVDAFVRTSCSYSIAPVAVRAVVPCTGRCVEWRVAPAAVAHHASRRTVGCTRKKTRCRGGEHPGRAMNVGIVCINDGSIVRGPVRSITVLVQVGVSRSIGAVMVRTRIRLDATEIRLRNTVVWLRSTVMPLGSAVIRPGSTRRPDVLGASCFPILRTYCSGKGNEC